MPGNYLKKAARACVGKTAFDTQQDAEKTADYRHRGYQCPVCHRWHLTSRSGPAKRPQEEPQTEPLTERPFRILADAVQAQIDARKATEEQMPPPTVIPSRPRTEEVRLEVRCISKLRKDHRVMLAIDGRIVKSRPIPESLRARIQEGAWVRVAPVEGSALVLEVLP